MSADASDIKIEIRDLTMAYGSYVVIRDIKARVQRGEVFIIMGGSGSGKSTLLKHMIGLKAPAQGDVLYDGQSFWHSSESEQQVIQRRFGVSFQGGALWSSMTLAENVALPLGEYTELSPKEINDIVGLKLSLVGLKDLKSTPLPNSPVGCASAPPWPEPWRWTRRFFSSTSHPPGWTRSAHADSTI